MRKLTALFIVLLIVTGVAFAQFPDGLKLSTWGRAVFVPWQGVFQDDVDPDFNSGVGAGWKPAYWGLDVSFTALDGRIGGRSDIARDDTTGYPGLGQLHIWGKPFGSDILYIAIGKIENNDFRGYTDVDGDFPPYVGGGKNGDGVFHQLNDSGALFISKPITGLSIFAFIKPGFDTFDSVTSGVKTDFKDAYKKIQIGFQYEISGIGRARAQWFGDTMDYSGGKIEYKLDPKTGVGPETTPDSWHSARLEAAFRLTAVEGLELDLGLKLPIPVEDDIGGIEVTRQDNFGIGVAGKYTAGDFSVGYGLYGAFGGSESSKSWSKRSDLAPSLLGIVEPAFYIAAIDSTVGGDVRFLTEGESSIQGQKSGDNGFTFGFGGWIKHGLGNGHIKTGLAYLFPKYGEQGTTGPSYLSWPIILELSF
jgi:hypothetical protein